jgi:gluconate kinase
VAGEDRDDRARVVTQRFGPDGGALLLTGVYGSGKSTIVGAIGDELEARGLPFAAIDLDWLHWSNMPATPSGEDEMLLVNLRSVVANYREVGVRYFVVAQSVRDRDQLDAIRGAIGMPLGVVRLTVEPAEVMRRLIRDERPISDVETATAWIDGSIGVGIEDVAIPNDGPRGTTIAALLEWAEWPRSADAR